jgi:SAM-dependent methyltransferase
MDDYASGAQFIRQIIRPVHQGRDLDLDSGFRKSGQETAEQLLGASTAADRFDDAKDTKGCAQVTDLVCLLLVGLLEPGCVRSNHNLGIYNQERVVAHYASARGLFPSERYLFGKYARSNADVLDVGVGGGRTTEHLAPGARYYLGVDYSAAMIEKCRARFPGLDFAVADATNLSTIGDDSFDLSVFSFNGIDCIPSDAGRIAALRELRRVTRPDGFIVISSHNARALGSFPDYSDADAARILWRTARAFWSVIRLSARMLPTKAFWRGSGYIVDPVHGGLLIHVSTPASVALDCHAAGLEIVECVGHFHPARVPGWLSPWCNYVLKRSE